MNRALALALAVTALLATGCPAPARDPCVVPSQKCGDRCVNTLSDPSSCGGCGIVCGGATSCCAGRCVDTQSSDANCGACGQSCGTGSCAGGTCACPNGAADHCAADPWPWCRDLTRDPAHCGDCGTACTGLANEVCSGGACGCFDPGHPTTCAAQATCTDLAVDPQNCGSCGEACTDPGKTRCTGGGCACASGSLTDCTEFGAPGCFDLQTDAAHCGQCTSACGAGEACCAGGCKATASDPQNCGRCGNVCPGGQACSNGACACAGATPLTCGPTCCAGTACCGTSCQVQHSNGLGGGWLDCKPLYTDPATTTDTAALSAALSWAPSGSTYLSQCDGSCLARQTATACGVWCYGLSTYRGRVLALETNNCTFVCTQLFGGAATQPWQ